MAEKKKGDVVFSGMRPTGRLHLGNYWGALRNWVELQDRYFCLFSIADWHMLTTGYENTPALKNNIRETALDWLAAGLDPTKCVIFRQSDVPEHAELTLLLSMVTPLSWLENNPTWKEQLQELAKTKHGKLVAGAAAAEEKPGEPAPLAAHELRTYGFLGYPVMQASDILMYGGTKVPVGQDQLPHLELSREIARRFNSVFGPVFSEPQPLLTPTPKVPGLDGRKMSKSYNNAVDLDETAASLQKKIMSSYTDPSRATAASPGHPEPCPENPPGCTVYALHKLYADDAFYRRRGDECRGGRIGCVACKKDLAAEMSKPFEEFRRRREQAAQAGRVEDVLAQGASKAREIARRTMSAVRKAMRIS